MRADARRNRARILEGARELFAERGPDAPLEEIARRAQVSIATLYRHFPERAVLIHEVALDVMARISDEATAAFQTEPDPFSALTRYMHRMIDLRIGVAMPALLARISFENDSELAVCREEMVTAVDKIINAARDAGLLRRDVTFADIGLAIMRLGRPLGQLPEGLDRRLSHRHLDLLIDGMRTGAHPARPIAGPALVLEDLRALPGPSDGQSPGGGSEAPGRRRERPAARPAGPRAAGLTGGPAGGPSGGPGGPGGGPAGGPAGGLSGGASGGPSGGPAGGPASGPVRGGARRRGV
jgi:AcrR family transcriptional regulator